MKYIEIEHTCTYTLPMLPGRINIVEMFILCNLMYRFQTMPTTKAMVFVLDMEAMTEKCVQYTESCKQPQQSWLRRTQLEAHCVWLSDICRASVIEEAWNCNENDINRRNKCKHQSQQQKSCVKERTTSSINFAGKIGYPCDENCKLIPFSHFVQRLSQHKTLT